MLVKALKKHNHFGSIDISCRLYLLQKAWIARTVDQNQWLQVKFVQRVEIRRVATQGRPKSNQWVTSYMLNYSSDGLLFYQYRTNKNQTVSSFADALSILMISTQQADVICRLVYRRFFTHIVIIQFSVSVVHVPFSIVTEKARLFCKTR